MNALALVGANLLLAVAGAGLLAFVGIVRTPSDLRRMAATAWLAGLAISGVAGAILAPFGFHVGWLLVLVPAVTAAGWSRIRRSNQPFTRPGRESKSIPSRMLAGVLTALTLSVGAVALWTFATAPLEEYDGWAMWGMKARALAAFGSAVPQVFAAPSYVSAHLEYPLAIPVIASLPVTVAGSFDSNLVVMQSFLIGAAGLAALWSLLRDRVRPLVLWAWLAAIATTPAVVAQIGSGYADVSLAVLVAAGLVCIARWVEDDQPPFLALGTVFLAAAALAKNEGALFAAAAVVSALAAAPGRRRLVLLSGACVLGALIPWRVWAGRHDLRSSDYELSSSFDPGYVLGRVGRVPLTFEWFWHHLLISGAWKPLPLIVVVAVIAGLIVRRSPAAVMGALFALLSVAGLTWIYLISPLGVEDFLDTNGARVMASVIVGTAALGTIIVDDLLEARSSAAGTATDNQERPTTPRNPQ